MASEMSKITVRIAGTANDSIVDGPGLRFALFTQGCPHGCPGCHNKHTHDFNGGREADISEITEKIRSNPLLDGITFSGGEPFCQPVPLAAIAREFAGTDLSIVTYTGYTFEYLLENSNDDNRYMDLLECTDILIDGPFVQSQRSIDILFRGSRNQRILDCKKSLESGKAVEIDENQLQ